jgi:tRNA nucleotidyltransferase/poly(A) polymerase
MLRDELLTRFPALASIPPNAVAVGGAVRDIILGRIPADVDVETDHPESCAAALGKVIPLGRGDLKVYRAVKDGLVYDFSGRTDLRRRDFTINAISVDLTTGEVQDPFHGQKHIQQRIVRMIEAKNFQDDPLRVLRGVRLALQFDFAIENETIVAIRRRASHIVTVAAERVTYELHTVLSRGTFRDAVRLLNETALDEALFGYAFDAGRFHADDVSLAGAYSLLVHDPKRFSERWKWSDALLREVMTLQHLLRDPDLLTIYEAGEGIGKQLPALFRAVDREVQPMPDFAMKPLLTGDDIAALGVVRGPALGLAKRALIEAQLRGRVQTREEAERLIRSAR